MAHHTRMAKIQRCLFGAVFIVLTVMGCSDRQSGKPNVLFIAVDDLNDWITLFNADNPIRTPHLERLAAKGAFFTHAYCSSPACNPSRVSLLTGTRPHSTGIYGNKSDWRRALPDAEATDFPLALMTYMAGNHAVRTDRWRYIQYVDGTEELYDHTVDENEWENLAEDERYAGVKAELKTHIPATNAADVADMEQPPQVKSTEYKAAATER
ncbi:Sulfatase [Parapedobacter composti]|uniref:Sulfatase n=2 Tax=Parapedobacter composti TaxID=623281 RepID=A0A1I1JUH3_9SPHI|nr:Sulfatase [Parapedobacter composti]